MSQIKEVQLADKQAAQAIRNSVYRNLRAQGKLPRFVLRNPATVKLSVDLSKVGQRNPRPIPEELQQLIEGQSRFGMKVTGIEATYRAQFPLLGRRPQDERIWVVVKGERFSNPAIQRIAKIDVSASPNVYLLAESNPRERDERHTHPRRQRPQVIVERGEVSPDILPAVAAMLVPLPFGKKRRSVWDYGKYTDLFLTGNTLLDIKDTLSDLGRGLLARRRYQEPKRTVTVTRSGSGN